MTKEITIKRYDINKPEEIVKMATTLKDYIVKQKLYTTIKGHNYAHVDGWAFAGFLTGILPRIENVEDLSKTGEIKWKTTVNLYKDDKIIGTGIALCSSKENNKKSFDEYAILSMSQTRAVGKAYRNLMGWIIKLAGYQSTPAEEMTKVGEIQTEPTEEKVIGEDKCSVCGIKITKQVAEYSQKMFKKHLCIKHQKEFRTNKK